MSLTPGKNPLWVDWTIAACAGFFVFALIFWAVADPAIRVLHSIEIVMYLAVMGLAIKRSPWGFGGGFFMALNWDYLNTLVSGFVKSGVEQLGTWFHTGQFRQPGLALAGIAGFTQLLLVVACIGGMISLRPGYRGWLRFLAGGVLAPIIIGLSAALFITRHKP